jgi:hypothetical protein
MGRREGFRNLGREFWAENEGAGKAVLFGAGLVANPPKPTEPRRSKIRGTL